MDFDTARPSWITLVDRYATRIAAAHHTFRRSLDGAGWDQYRWEREGLRRDPGADPVLLRAWYTRGEVPPGPAGERLLELVSRVVAEIS